VTARRASRPGGAAAATAHLDHDDAIVEDIVDAWWRPTVLAALDR
jgi:hypothetical protein